MLPSSEPKQLTESAVKVILISLCSTIVILLENYKNGRYEETEKLYNEITEIEKIMPYMIKTNDYYKAL